MTEMVTGSLLNDLQVAATNQLLEALVESEGRMRRRLELLSEVVFELDTQGHIVFLNPAWLALTGFSSDQMLGHSFTKHLLPDDSAALSAALKNASAKPEGRKTLLRFVHASGGLVWMELTIVTIGAGHVGALHDITAQKRIQDQLEYIAHYDILTKMPNRALLADRIEQALASCQRHQRLLAIGFLDLDGFKAVNDQYGHDAGDQLLATVAKRLRSALRDGDSIARIGGDEFVVVLVDLETLSQIRPVLDRLLQVASEPVRVGEAWLQVSASIGVTVYPQDDVGAEHLIRHADQAMYVAKQSGKNRYHFFDVAKDTAVRTAGETLERLHQALVKSEFVLYYQPKLNMRTERIFGAEALIRWRHPENGLQLPGVFLPTIENHVLSVQVGEWVITSALAQLATWTALGQDLVISVNVSAYQLQQENFASVVRELLMRCPLPKPGALIFEILETSALDDTQRVSKVIRECQSMGIAFALDDFGTGYSSLTYLKQLPAETLKIDRSFVHDMLTNRDDLAIVKGIIALAKAFRRKVIAEGVETRAHMDKLRRLGCESVQGFAIARPMPAADFLPWSATQKPSPRQP
jgi:diguanylate cyclase (GGDEF)-like protein/PAS domain S-box-containing protein